MKIALGADCDGFDLKQAVKEYLLAHGHTVEDLGVDTGGDEAPYYRIALQVAKQVTDLKVERGILCCGTGMGMAIVANKAPGIYAAVCETIHAAEKARSINNANVLALGGMFTTPVLAAEIVETWLQTEFTQGWQPSTQTWLENSLKDIAELEVQQFNL